MHKAADSICVKMVSAHKESAEVVALLCCCLRYLKIRGYRPYPSVPVLVCAPRFARENKKNFFSLRLPCLFDRSIYPHHHPHNVFFSLSWSRDLRWRLNSRSLRHGFDLKWFRFRNSLLWSIFAPWRKHRATCLSYFSVSACSILLYLTCIQFLRKKRFSLPSGANLGGGCRGCAPPSLR